MEKARFLIISDMHYTTEEDRKELKEKYPDSNASAANGRILGYTQAQRMEFMMEEIRREHEKEPLTAILIPGDLSVDDYDFRNLPYNYCEKFKKEYMDQMPAPVYAMPGNHDSYSNEQWQAMFGTPRQFSVVLGGALFLMADTYNAPTNGASGSPYTGLDMAWIRAELEKHPDKPAFLLSHYIHWRKEGDLALLLREYPRIRALFVGHSHRYETVRLGEEYNNRSIYDIGAYSYYTRPTLGKWDFNVFHQEWRWGYQMLTLEGDTYETQHISPAQVYHGHNGNFDLFREETPADKDTLMP